MGKMDLPNELLNANDKYGGKGDHFGRNKKPIILSATEVDQLGLINVTDMQFGSDYTWLYEPSVQYDNPVDDLQSWLYTEMHSKEMFKIGDHNLNDSGIASAQKIIDTRTFTRPKKRFARPSLERYNDSTIETIQSPGDSMKQSSDSGVCSSENILADIKPLEFDLNLPSNNYFEKLANSSEVDSFQNMSPPSLVTSLCSSTFSNLMENSFIKNDPVLREIRDKDFTDTILLEDIQASLYQSFNESCSSLTSETPEGFLKRVYNNHSNQADVEDPDLNQTYDQKPNSNGPTPQRSPNFGNTYKRTPVKKNSTFRKSDKMKIEPNPESDSDELSQFLDASKGETFNLSSRPDNMTKEDVINGIKKNLSNLRSVQNSNRLSFIPNDESSPLNSSRTRNNSNLKRASMNSSGSADSLDRMSSSLSNSSKGSNKMLNVTDVEHIVEMQERSLNQVMSTPKVSAKEKKLWDNCISPIARLEANSDSDLSSNDDYKSVKSSNSKISLDSMGPRPVEKKKEVKTRVSGLSNAKSYASLAQMKNKNENLSGSHSNLYKYTYSNSNLKSMGTKLKGSYTNLKPSSANLPVVPPPGMNRTFQKIGDLNSTQTIEPAYTKHQVGPHKEAQISEDGVFVKPAQPRLSSLPRPVGSATGIPRPASRIPGPRSSRPSIARPTNGKAYEGYH